MESACDFEHQITCVNAILPQFRAHISWCQTRFTRSFDEGSFS